MGGLNDADAVRSARARSGTVGTSRSSTPFPRNFCRPHPPESGTAPESCFPGSPLPACVHLTETYDKPRKSNSCTIFLRPEIPTLRSVSVPLGSGHVPSTSREPGSVPDTGTQHCEIRRYKSLPPCSFVSVVAGQTDREPHCVLQGQKDNGAGLMVLERAVGATQAILQGRRNEARGAGGAPGHKLLGQKTGLEPKSGLFPPWP